MESKINMLKLSCRFCLVDVDKKEVVRNHSCEEYFLFGAGGNGAFT